MAYTPHPQRGKNQEDHCVIVMVLVGAVEFAPLPPLMRGRVMVLDSAFGSTDSDNDAGVEDAGVTVPAGD